MITYRKATAEDVCPALDLALQVFNAFEAADYEPEALVRFNAVVDFEYIPDVYRAILSFEDKGKFVYEHYEDLPITTIEEIKY